jgi:hypothetical protein
MVIRITQRKSVLNDKFKNAKLNNQTTKTEINNITIAESIEGIVFLSGFFSLRGNCSLVLLIANCISPP